MIDMFDLHAFAKPPIFVHQHTPLRHQRVWPLWAERWAAGPITPSGADVDRKRYTQVLAGQSNTAS